MQEKTSFGAMLKHYRLAAGLSQEALAERASLSTRAISDLERGINRTPRYDTLELLVTAMSLSVQQRDVLRAAAHPALALALEERPASVLSGLPLATTRFIGREAELAQIEDYLNDPDCRLLTLIGPGGVGKTRLAYQAAVSKAGDFSSGVCAVPLAGVASPEYLLSTLAERLKLHLYGSAGQKAEILEYLREKRLLLLLDNCEHLLDGIEMLDEILAVAPSVKILATSRERLNLQGEWLLHVQGLPFPRNESEPGAETYSAVQLFVQSARRGGPGFQLADVTDVVRICKLVEGLPLAIERTEEDTSTRAYAMSYATTLLAQLDPSWAGSYLNEGLRISEKLGLQALVAMFYVHLSFTEADYVKATELLEQAISILRQLEARNELTVALFLYGDRARTQGNLSRAEALYQESLNMAQANQNRELMLSPLGNLGRLAVHRGDYERAAVLLQQTVAIARDLGSRVKLSDWLVYLGTLELYRGDYNAAGKLLEVTLALYRNLGSQMGIAHASHCLADLALHQGDYVRATKLVSDSLLISQSFLGNFSNREFTVMRLLIVSKLARASHDYEKATQLLGAAESLREQSGYLLEPLPRTEYEEAVAQLPAQLDPAVFEAAWAEGQAMAEAEAITSALGYLRTKFDVVG